MKTTTVRILLLLIVGLVLTSVTGCQSDDPENVSVRPWDAPQNWEGGIPINNQQHN